MPDLFPCSITITHGGTPCEGASVSLLQKEGGSIGWDIGARTNSKGVAQIATGTDFKGAPAGEYSVVVTKMELEPSKIVYPPPEDPVAHEKWYNEMKSEKRAWYSSVKAEFTNAKTTPHSITVTKKGTTATFDVGEPVNEVVKF
ncbi:MAG: hypothetical protein FWC43_14015 [Planctomycetaceae bacterium]|nr:hypothetical protein [Planctomycetaceae bacterium]